MKPSDFLTELSTEKLAQYKTAAAADASKRDSAGDYKKGDKRFSGIVKATKKQFANDEKKVGESAGLPSPSTYEETNDMFKSSGQRRIGSLTTEDEQIDGMAQGEIRAIIKNAIHIKNQLDKGVSLDGWMYSYVTTSNDHLNSVAEQINNPNIDEQELDEACWKGYHKEGNKKMFGKTYPNCVKNEGVAEGSNDTIYPNAEVIKSKNGKPIGEIYQDEYGWGCLHYKADFGADGMSNREEALEQLKDMHNERRQQGVAESQHSESCPHCGGEMVSEELMNEKKDACYYKVKSRYKVWPSAYASGALVKCRKKGASNWGTGGKSNESVAEGYPKDLSGISTDKLKAYLAKQNQKQVPGKDNQIKRVRAELRRREERNFGNIDDEEENQWWIDYDMKEGVAEGFDKEAEAYKAHLLKTAPKVMDFLSKAVKGWRPSKEEMLGAIDTGYMVMKHTGDVKQAGKAMMDELNTLHRMSQGQQGVAEGQLDEKWTKKYKDSINCSNPKGFSQKAHCAGKQKNESSILEGLEQVDENLHKWFKEKWVRFGPDGKIRGDCARGDDSEGKPKCLPQSKAHNLGKKGRASAAARKRREDPNPERHGKAINVNTKKK